MTCIYIPINDFNNNNCIDWIKCNCDDKQYVIYPFGLPGDNFRCQLVIFDDDLTLQFKLTFSHIIT